MAAREPLLTVDEVAAWLQVTKDWIYDEIEAGRFPTVRLGRKHVRFEPEAIREYIADGRQSYPNE